MTDTKTKPTPKTVLHNGKQWILEERRRTYSVRDVALFLIGAENEEVTNLYIDLDGDDFTLEYEIRKPL